MKKRKKQKETRNPNKKAVEIEKPDHVILLVIITRGYKYPLG